MSRGGELCRLQSGNTAEILQPRQHLLNSLKPDTPYENTTIAIKRHSHLCCSGRHAVPCGLCIVGISEHDIVAHRRWLPRTHAANAAATANLCRPATVPSP